MRVLQFDEDFENEKWEENGEKIHGSGVDDRGFMSYLCDCLFTLPSFLPPWSCFLLQDEETATGTWVLSHKGLSDSEIAHDSSSHFLFCPIL